MSYKGDHWTVVALSLDITRSGIRSVLFDDRYHTSWLIVYFFLRVVVPPGVTHARHLTHFRHLWEFVPHVSSDRLCDLY